MFSLKTNETSLKIACFAVVGLLPLNAYAYVIIENQFSMSFVKIPAGEFKMGLDDYEMAIMEVPVTETGPAENELKDELPQHVVKFEQGFYIAQTEITQRQWHKIMQNRPGHKKLWQQKNWEKLPVTSVSWSMANKFTQELTEIDEKYTYRLPTEAEWEYVARAGSNEYRPVPFDDLEEHAWFINNSGDEVQPVASRERNAYGVHDMLGNVWEWVDDWYAPDTYTLKKRRNPSGPAQGSSRVRRGGSYHCPVHLIRPGYRAANKPGVAYEVTGFRVILEVKQ